MMEKRATIKVAGRELPCYPTMGAMIRFHQLTGKEVTAIGNNISDVGAYLYCSVAAACSREGIDFDMELVKFADCIDVEDLSQWAQSINDTSDTKKKKAKSL